MDMVPPPGQGWDETALRAALDLGWIPSCGASGSAPVCPLVPAIQFIGYNGYAGHGDPAHAGKKRAPARLLEQLGIRLPGTVCAARMGGGLSVGRIAGAKVRDCLGFRGVYRAGAGVHARIVRASGGGAEEAAGRFGRACNLQPTISTSARLVRACTPAPENEGRDGDG